MLPLGLCVTGLSEYRRSGRRPLRVATHYGTQRLRARHVVAVRMALSTLMGAPLTGAPALRPRPEVTRNEAAAVAEETPEERVVAEGTAVPRIVGPRMERRAKER